MIYEDDNIHDEGFLARQFQQSGNTLNNVPGLPAQLKRDLRNLFQQSNHNNKNIFTKISLLLQLYERALKLLTLSSNGLPITSHIDLDRVIILSDELQHLIIELDFDGEVGERLFDIRNHLLNHPNAQTLIELTLATIKLIIDGIHNERKDSQVFLSLLHDDLSDIEKNNTFSKKQAQTLHRARHDFTKQLQTSTHLFQKELLKNCSLTTLKKNLKALTNNFDALIDCNNKLMKNEQQLLEQLRHNERKLATLNLQTMDYRRQLGIQEQKLLQDPLTKVYSRAALDDRLEQEYRNWLHSNSPFCLAMIDIDYFKKVNDQYGHLVGDKVLKVIANTIHQCLQKTDFIARFGGEEFVVLLPNSDEKTRIKRLNHILKTIANLPFKFKNEPLKVTISIGASIFKDQDNTVDLLERADHALHRAKSKGKNQIVWA